MNIKSVFENNEEIPKKYSCDGEDINPELDFEYIPEDAKSLALIVDDPDAPGGTFTHWILININPNINKIEENSKPEEAIEVKNSFNKKEYGGPCPPSGTHNYKFKLYALDTKLSGVSDKQEVVEAMENHIIEQAELTGKFTR